MNKTYSNRVSTHKMIKQAAEVAIEYLFYVGKKQITMEQVHTIN